MATVAKWPPHQQRNHKRACAWIPPHTRIDLCNDDNQIRCTFRAGASASDGGWCCFLALFEFERRSHCFPTQPGCQRKATISGWPCEFIFDSTSNLSRDDVVQSDVWEEVGDQSYTKGVEEGVVWLRFSIQNTSDESIHRAIHISNGLSDTATAWITQPDGSITRFDAGEDTRITRPCLCSFSPRFPIALDPGDQIDVLLKMNDEGTMSVPIEVAEYDYLEANDGTRQWINGLMSGVLGLVGFYALALWTRIRHRIFGWLTALAFASLLQWMFYHWGHAGTWIAPSIRPWMVNRLIVACFELTAGFSFFFYIEACQLNRYHPRLTRIIQTFAWVGFLNAGLIFFIPYPIAVQVLFLGVFGLVFLAVTVIIRSVRVTPFLAAWSWPPVYFWSATYSVY